MSWRKNLALAVIFVLSNVLPGFTQSSTPPWGDMINIEPLRADIRFISDDITEGRSPGTTGELISAKYIAARFEMLGLKPLGPHDSYFQEVPMVGVTTSEDTKLVIRRGDKQISLMYLTDMVAATYLFNEKVSIEDAPMVFVGYGINAPEYKWNDFQGTDMRGRILVILVNDPPATKKDPNLFEGKAMTYYGRWTYKFEEARRQGALGALIIHNTEMAGYPWQVVQSSWSGEQVYLDIPQKGDELRLAAWISESSARQLFQMSGLKFDEMLEKAGKQGFRSVPLKTTLSVVLDNKFRRFKGLNVVGYLPGNDETLKSEAIIYTAHHDHLGKGQPVNGDEIYNGAFDNATGVASLIAAAQAWSSAIAHGFAPRRSAIFLAVTGEESGLLGSLYFARYPLWPRENLVAALNLDGVNPFGPTKDMVPLGYERTTMDQVVIHAAEELNIDLRPDPFPEKGYFFRSDHFSFSRFGIPAISFDSGTQYVGKPPEYGIQLQEEYTAKHYHQPSDEYNPEWPLTGTKQLVEFVTRIGWKLATMNDRPQWKPGKEVKIPE